LHQHPSPIIPLIILLRRCRWPRTAALPHSHCPRPNSPASRLLLLLRLVCQAREAIPEVLAALVQGRIPSLPAAVAVALDEPVEAVLRILAGQLGLARKLRRRELCLLGKVAFRKLQTSLAMRNQDSAEVGTYALGSRLDVPVVHRLGRLRHRRREPSESLGQRRHRVLLQVV
jgi:hypothetical protein